MKTCHEYDERNIVIKPEYICEKCGKELYDMDDVYFDSDTPYCEDCYYEVSVHTDVENDIYAG